MMVKFVSILSLFPIAASGTTCTPSRELLDADCQCYNNTTPCPKGNVCNYNKCFKPEELPTTTSSRTEAKDGKCWEVTTTHYLYNNPNPAAPEWKEHPGPCGLPPSGGARQLQGTTCAPSRELLDANCQCYNNTTPCPKGNVCNYNKCFKPEELPTTTSSRTEAKDGKCWEVTTTHYLYNNPNPAAPEWKEHPGPCGLPPSGGARQLQDQVAIQGAAAQKPSQQAAQRAARRARRAAKQAARQAGRVAKRATRRAGRAAKQATRRAGRAAKQAARQAGRAAKRAARRAGQRALTSHRALQFWFGTSNQCNPSPCGTQQRQAQTPGQSWQSQGNRRFNWPQPNSANRVNNGGSASWLQRGPAPTRSSPQVFGNIQQRNTGNRVNNGGTFVR